MSIKEIDDPNNPPATISLITRPNGSEVHLTFKDIVYQDSEPTSASGLTLQLLVKATETEDDTSPIINVGNTELVLLSDPFVVGYSIDTTQAGFEEDGVYYAELWVTDGPLGKDILKRMNIKLTDSYKENFS